MKPEVPADAAPPFVVIGTRHHFGTGWVHVDGDSTPLYSDDDRQLHPVDVVADARKIPLPDDYAGFVFSSEAIEHFPWAQTTDVLREWARLVRPGGTIRIEAPDFLAAAQQILVTDTLECDQAMNQIFYGGQSSRFDYHQSLHTPRTLTAQFEGLGFTVVNVQRGFECGWLRVDARRPV